jgi:hypothetical protein
METEGSELRLPEDEPASPSISASRRMTLDARFMLPIYLLRLVTLEGVGTDFSTRFDPRSPLSPRMRDPHFDLSKCSSWPVEVSQSGSHSRSSHEISWGRYAIERRWREPLDEGVNLAV